MDPSMPTAPPRPEPLPDRAPLRAVLAHQVRVQARACAVMGSPLYAVLLSEAATDVDVSGVVWQVLRAHVRPGRGDAIALRLMAAVHRLVLDGRAPALAAHYPSAGGTPADDAWDAFRATVEEHATRIAELVARPCQTNEVGRCAALVWAFLVVAARTRMPLRLAEIGASAGLNLRWDRYRYSGDGAAWGPTGSPVDLSGLWRDRPPELPDVSVVARSGCDRQPVDAATADGRLTLMASVWADQPDRLARLQGALRVAAHVPAELVRASADEWLPARLATPHVGTVTVVYQSVVDEYLSADVRRRVHETLAEAGARATAAAPLAWARLEPLSELRAHGVTLTTWPGGHTQVLCVCGAHGQDVRRPTLGA